MVSYAPSYNFSLMFGFHKFELVHMSHNNLVNSSALGHFVLFADDTNIFVSGKSKNDAYKNANKVMDEISKYMYTNQLHINMEKSVYMYFRPSLSYLDRLTCARTQEFGSEPVIKIGNQKLKKLIKSNF